MVYYEESAGHVDSGDLYFTLLDKLCSFTISLLRNTKETKLSSQWTLVLRR